MRVAVKGPNCLIKNLLESESLPQIRNLLEMREINPARLKLRSGVENEADDEGSETSGGGDSESLSQSGQEGEGTNSDGVRGVDGIRTLLCGAGITQSGADSAGKSQTARPWRCGEETVPAWSWANL